MRWSCSRYGGRLVGMRAGILTMSDRLSLILGPLSFSVTGINSVCTSSSWLALGLVGWSVW